MLNETKKYSGREIYEVYRKNLEYEHNCLINKINDRRKSKEECDLEFYITHIQSIEDKLQGMITLMIDAQILTESVDIQEERQRVRENLGFMVIKQKL